MKTSWFKEWKWIYLPISAEGWIFTVMILLFCLQIILAVGMQVHSVTDFLYGIFPFVVPALGLFNWLASKTSQQKDQVKKI